MKKVVTAIVSFLFLFTVSVSKAWTAQSEDKIIVGNTGDLMIAAHALNVPGAGSSTIIYIKPNIYTIRDTVRINRSNVTIIAEPGTKFVLANKVNRPVLAIGSQEQNPSYIVENISISGITIDGNKANQTSEYDVKFPWIRNNGIDVRRVKRLTLANVISGNNRSGGLVISWGSSDIHIDNSQFSDNYFDGVAYYDSTRIFTNNSTMRFNQNAGISLDNDFGDSIFSNCILDSNGDVGIFMRNSTKIRFNNCAIQDSGSHAAFLSHDETNNGVHDIMFSGCQILNNNGGIFVSSGNQSDYTSIVGSVFRGNEKNGRKSIDSAGSTVWQSGNIVMD